MQPAVQLQPRQSPPPAVYLAAHGLQSAQRPICPLSPVGQPGGGRSFRILLLYGQIFRAPARIVEP